jgi:hypothetical protein
MQQDPKTGQMVPAQDFPPPPPDAKMQEVQIKAAAQRLDEMEFQAGMQEKKARLYMDLQETVAKIADLQADAALKASQAKSTEAEPAIKLIYAEIEAQGMRKQHILNLLELVSSHITENKKIAASAEPGTTAAAGMSAPLLPAPSTVQ